ncbi:MAG TPA: hypothetical protein PK177_06865 [Burkholderiaceae bacterium]|nr:hypothetical protein [Burkholderiaceae bacterium]
MALDRHRFVDGLEPLAIAADGQARGFLGIRRVQGAVAVLQPQDAAGDIDLGGDRSARLQLQQAARNRVVGGELKELRVGGAEAFEQRCNGLAAPYALGLDEGVRRGGDFGREFQRFDDRFERREFCFAERCDTEGGNGSEGESGANGGGDLVDSSIGNAGHLLGVR